MRTISGTLLTAQTSLSRKPYIYLHFVSKDLMTERDYSTNSGRIRAIEHVEELFNEYAVIVLQNSDKGVANVLGYWCEIGYGDYVSGVPEYAGDSVNGGAYGCSRLWVKSQQTVSAGGQLYTILELEGMWTWLREELAMLGSAPYYRYNSPAADTVYTVLERFIETEVGWTLDALGTQNDSIINTLQLQGFDVNNQTSEYMAGLIYRLIRLTKCFLRPRAILGFTVRYPQATDAIDLTFYSNQAPWFYKYTNRSVVHIPNRILVHGNAGADGNYFSAVTGDAQDAPSIAAYAEVFDLAKAPDILTTLNVDLIAASLLSKVKAESVVGIGEVSHHCAVELLDKIRFIDNRVSQSIYPSDGTVRVGALKHIFRPGQYRLQITLGGATATGETARFSGTILFSDFEERVQEAAIPRGIQRVEAGPTAPAVPRPVTGPVPESIEGMPERLRQQLREAGQAPIESMPYLQQRLRDIQAELDRMAKTVGVTVPRPYTGPADIELIRTESGVWEADAPITRLPALQERMEQIEAELKQPKSEYTPIVETKTVSDIVVDWFKRLFK